MSYDKKQLTCLWPDMPDEVLNELNELITFKTIRKKEHLYNAGEEPQNLYFIYSGLIGLTIFTQGGNERLMRTFKRGDFLGYRSLLSNEEYHATAVGLSLTEVGVIPKNFIFKLIREYPEFNLFLLNKISKDLGRAEIRLSYLSEKDVQSRVAESLLYLKEIYSDHNWTRKEIADFCSSTTSTVIKVLSQFEKNGWIEQKGREIKILDSDSLIDLAAE